MFILNDIIKKAKKKKATGIIISMDKFPQLSENYNDLLEFMNSELYYISLDHFLTVKDWNKVRDQAKNKFTAPLISKLDVSGIIKEYCNSFIRAAKKLNTHE